MKYAIVCFSLIFLVACGSTSDPEKHVEEPAEERPIEQPSSENEKAEEPIAELIQVALPLPNEEISSSLQMRGKAKGYWYFEGDFPVRLEDKDGNTLAKGYAVAQDEWMTRDWVPFEGTLELPALPDNERGYLVFTRNNPSDLRENDREYRLPVLFPSNK